MTFIREVGEDELRREKAKARELRRSSWWKRRLAAGRCGYCGRPTPPRALTMDHRVPLVRGGRSTKGNVVPACKDCNNAKKYLLPIEWETYLARLDEPKASEERQRSSPARKELDKRAGPDLG
jgi:5-methylcytosine-specific restriction endonuclease McrA